jgi:hypothetical protein
LVHHLRLLLLESLPNPFTPCHELLHASSNATGFALNKRFGGEVVDAGVEAVGYKVGEHLER